MFIRQLKELNKLQQEYVNLLWLCPLGGEEMAQMYLTNSALSGQLDVGIRSLQTKITKLKKKLSGEGFVLEKNV